MKKIAVLTSGGDAPGMNAAIRGVVRCACSRGMEVYGVERGYTGLINGKLNRMDSRSVSDTIQKGGTILKTARCPEFNTEEGLKKGADVLNAYGIDGLVVIGGDGSFRGMRDLSEKYGIVCMGIPGTIDNDLGYTDFTLGFDTAVNTVLDAMNKIRDTMTSHDRACVIEVMGRHCGDIALYSGIAGGAESILVPELPFDIDEICNRMKKNIIKGKISDIIVLAEGVGSCLDVKKDIVEKTGITVRTVKLGYIQRGGTPSMQDRVLAARCADRAVTLLYEGATESRVIGIKENKIIDMPIGEALEIKKTINKEMLEMASRLSH
ncbi:MAG: 6-phosphofructokinase [Clostridia bacterium]|nr:6-phosphofructokinase [Clostridia bacterium]